MIATASTASCSGCTVRGLACMTSRMTMFEKSCTRSIRRRKSPSVNTPIGRCSASTTAVMPMPFWLTSSRAWASGASGLTAGTASPLRITSRTWVSRRRPRAPPGCERAKSSSRKPRASSRATARASPRASVTVVLAVGARFIGQASFATEMSRCTSLSCARRDCGLPVMAIRGVPMRLTTGRMSISSEDSPEFEMAMKTSCAVTMPRSPWAASPGCTNMAGVPVEARVAAILRAMWPDLPMPDTTTRPVQAYSTATARTRESSASRRSCRALTASASMARVSRARAITRRDAFSSKLFCIVFSSVTLIPEV